MRNTSVAIYQRSPDGDDGEDFLRLVEDAVAEGPETLVLDLSATDALSTAEMDAVLAAYEGVRSAGVRPVIAAGPVELRDALRSAAGEAELTLVATAADQEPLDPVEPDR